MSIRKNLHNSPYGPDDRPEPYLGKKSRTGWYALKIKHTTTKVWAKRSCGTKIKWEAQLGADMVYVLGLMGKLTVVDEIADGAITLTELREHWMRIRESILVLGGSGTDLHAILLRILEERAAAAGTRKMSALIDLWEKDAPAKHERYPEQMRVMLALPWVQDNVAFFTLKNCTDMLLGSVIRERDSIKNTDGTPMATATLQRYFSALKACFRWAKKNEIVLSNPVAEPKCIEFEKTKDEKAAEAETPHYTAQAVRDICAELQRMAVLDPTLAHMPAMCALSFATGAEINALMRLRRRDFISLRAALVRIDGHKRFHRRNRTVDISVDWATKIVMPYVMTLTSPDAFFLPRTKEQENLDTHLYAPYEKCRKALETACETLGITYEGFHKFRHSLCQYWISRGLLDGKVPNRGLKWIVTQCGWSNERQFFLTYGKFIAAYQTEQSALSARAEGDWWEPTHDEQHGFLAVA